jgi:hypothetical protein
MTAAPPPFQAHRRPNKQLPELNSRDDICFLHPGYDGKNVVLSLPRVDCTASTPATPAAYGVHHNTALLACQIIAGNAFDGSFLAFDQAG